MRNAEWIAQGSSPTPASEIEPALSTPHSAFRIPQLAGRPVALLELLAATARARFVAAYAGVGVASQCRGRLGHGGLAGAPQVGVAACNEVVRGGLARHH